LFYLKFEFLYSRLVPLKASAVKRKSQKFTLANWCDLAFINPAAFIVGLIAVQGCTAMRQ
jgi:hypothetical protein